MAKSSKKELSVNARKKLDRELLNKAFSDVSIKVANGVKDEKLKPHVGKFINQAMVALKPVVHKAPFDPRMSFQILSVLCSSVQASLTPKTETEVKADEVHKEAEATADIHATHAAPVTPDHKAFPVLKTVTGRRRSAAEVKADTAATEALKAFRTAPSAEAEINAANLINEANKLHEEADKAYKEYKSANK